MEGDKAGATVSEEDSTTNSVSFKTDSLERNSSMSRSTKIRRSFHEKATELPFAQNQNAANGNSGAIVFLITHMKTFVLQVTLLLPLAQQQHLV